VRRIPIRKKWAGMVLLSMLVTSGTLAVTASAASATPAECTTVNGGNFAESFCTDGIGQHRVVMVQRHFLYPDVPDLHCVGPWMPVGLTSQIDCASEQVIALTVQTREDPIFVPGQPDMMVPVPVNTNPPRIRVPKPPGMATPVPVTCFRQKFEELIVRVSDNKPVYVFIVGVTTCANQAANFAAVEILGIAQPIGPLIPQIVLLREGPATAKPPLGVEIALAASVTVRFCVDPSTQSGCQTFAHNFTGTANALRTVGDYTFDPIV
jgi:hypothetical protein